MSKLLAKLAPCNLVLVEGYKRHSHAKIEVFRAAAELALIQPDDPTVHAVATDVALDGQTVPTFDLDDTAAIADFILAGTEHGAAPDGLAVDCFAPQGAGALATVAKTAAMLRAALVKVTASERVPLAAAAGRILAADVTAARANPPAANSAMDGYGLAAASLPASLPTSLPTGGPARLAPFAGRAAAGVPYRNRARRRRRTCSDRRPPAAECGHGGDAGRSARLKGGNPVRRRSIGWCQHASGG